jgi:hypothetical protein
MNVNPTRLGGFAQFRDAFHLKFQSFENALHESWALETNGIKDAVTRRELARAMLGDDTFQNPRTTALMLHRVEGLRREISAMGQEIAAKFQNFTSLTRVDPHQVGIWVTIQFIADYALNGLFDGQDVRQMTASDLANKTLGNEFVRFLASDEVGILHLNPVSGQSATYYENGKIPWDDRPTHRVSIFLYLDWMNRTLNPFELFDSNTTPAKFREWSSSYIWRLGRAIEQVKETHMFGHNTVEPQRVIGAIASQQAEAAMWNAMY